jgi:hypothetical protein
MNPTTQVEHQAWERADDHPGQELARPRGEKARRALKRTILWSYERGSWQYDLICLVILAFIFLTPRAWFRDRPTLQLTDLRRNQGVVDLGLDRDGRRYMVDARLVESLAPLKLDDAVGEILRRRLQKPPVVKSIDPIQDRNKVILGYTVVVAP